MVFLAKQFCVIIFIMSIVSSIHCTKTQYGSLYGEIVLSCKTSHNYENLRWNRNKAILANGLKTTDKTRWTGRLNISLDGYQYNLHISNLTKEDTGLYWCEIQNGGNIIQHNIYLFIQEISTEELSTDGIIEGSTSLSLPSTLITTLRTTNQDNRYNIQTEIYIIVAVGFVALIAVSIGCKIFIYKYQTRSIEISRLQGGQNDTIDDPNNLEGVDYPNYEIIDENDLISVENVGEVVQLNTLPTHPSLSASYLEVFQSENSNSSTSSAGKGSRFTSVDSVKMSLSGYLLAYKSGPNANTQYNSLTLLKELSNMDSGVKLRTNESKDNLQTSDKALFVKEMMVRRHSCP